MDAERRLTGWLRFLGALALALGLSSAAASAAAGTSDSPREPLAVTHLSVSASAPSAAVHTGTTVRHAVAKHRLPAVASGLAAAALTLAGLAFGAIRRRRTDPTPRDHALSDGARAPPAVSCS
jgi:hypothetical protein